MWSSFEHPFFSRMTESGLIEVGWGYANSLTTWWTVKRRDADTPNDRRADEMGVRKFIERHIPENSTLTLAVWRSRI